MKLYVKQMYDWNYYACYAEDVDEKYWNYFKTELWWQLGNGFIKTYDNVEGFEYCAKNFMARSFTMAHYRDEKDRRALVPSRQYGNGAVGN